MSVESSRDAAEIHTALQRGEIPASLRPDVRAVWRQTSGRALAAAAFVTLFVLLLLTGPLFIAGFKTSDLTLWIFFILVAVVFCVLYGVFVLEHLRRRQELLADVTVGWVKSAVGEVF